VEAEITPDKLRAGSEPGPIPEPLRLIAQPDSRRAARLARRDPRLGRRRGAGPPSRPRPRPASRRRRGDRRAIVASVLAVLALVGCVMAILMLATQPTAARLEHEIGALNRRLAADEIRLATLRATVVRTGARGSVLSRQLNHVAHRLTGHGESAGRRHEQATRHLDRTRRFDQQHAQGRRSGGDRGRREPQQQSDSVRDAPARPNGATHDVLGGGRR